MESHTYARRCYLGRFWAYLIVDSPFALFCLALLASVAAQAGMAAPNAIGNSTAEHHVATKRGERRAVLILSGVQVGLPVSDAVIASTVAFLKGKGTSANDIYVENLDLVRHGQAHNRAALAAVLKGKLAKVRVGLVIVVNSAVALDFLAAEGRGLVAPEVPVVTSFVQRPAAAWGSTPPPS